ncbi:MAG: GNAT family N-acetyltransferase [Alteromonadaceae bacterium]|nr:GNAT family N-acetyltransferase [Alteromonadaceae bacterium]
MKEFYTLSGRAALGTRLRRLGEQLASDAVPTLDMYKVEIDLKWFPVLYMLMQKKTAAVMELAEDIGQSHPAVSQIVKEMTKAGLTQTTRAKLDKRITEVTLTRKGKTMGRRLEQQCQDADQAVGQLFADANVDLWAAINLIEAELDKTSFFKRMKVTKREREMQALQFVPYQHQYKNDFTRLNEAWIKKYFKLEPEDSKALDNPEGYIVEKGGYIAFAQLDQDVVGTCALIPMTSKTGLVEMELAKMAVTENVQGLGVGFLLAQHMVDVAKQKGVDRLYLESNTKLAPAIHLYKKLGFKQIMGDPSPYQRANIQMELLLTV